MLWREIPCLWRGLNWEPCFGCYAVTKKHKALQQAKKIFMPPSRSTMTYHNPIMGPIPFKIETKKDVLISQCPWNYGKPFFGRILLEGIRCCGPKKPLPTASGLLSLLRECFAKAHFWKHKPGAEVVGFPTHLWAVPAFPQGISWWLRSEIREHLV